MDVAYRHNSFFSQGIVKMGVETWVLGIFSLVATKDPEASVRLFGAWNMRGNVVIPDFIICESILAGLS